MHAMAWTKKGVSFTKRIFNVYAAFRMLTYPKQKKYEWFHLLLLVHFLLFNAHVLAIQTSFVRACCQVYLRIISDDVCVTVAYIIYLVVSIHFIMFTACLHGALCFHEFMQTRCSIYFSLVLLKIKIFNESALLYLFKKKKKLGVSKNWDLVCTCTAWSKCVE